MKKVLSFLLCLMLLLSAIPTAAAVTDDEPDGGYYIVFKGDNYTIRERNRLNYYGGDVFLLGGLTMSLSTPFRIAYSSDLKTVSKFYPEGEGNDYVPRYNSRWYTVEFHLTGNNSGDSSDMGWYDGYVSAYPCEPPEEGGGAIDPAAVEMKRELYEQDFFKSFPFCDPESYDYSELYYHHSEGHIPDWVLVQVTPAYPVEGGSYGVFDDAVFFNAESYPFDFCYGVYDVRERAYYSITDAWSMGYADLHDVFVHRIRTCDYAYQLGDVNVDGELDIVDATLLQRGLVGLYDLDEHCAWGGHTTCTFGTAITSLADYDKNGDADIVDVTRIQRTLVGNALYPHSFTLTAQLDQSGHAADVRALSSFGEEPLEYCYRIECSVYADSVYGSDFGRFHLDNNDPEPGNFQITTGWISDSSVELPLTSLTYNDNLTLTVQARDSRGNKAQTAVLYFKNVY